MKRSRSAADWLGMDPEVRDLRLRVGRLIELQALLAASVESGGIEVLSLEDGTLAVATANASEAARLRQREPSVVAALRRRGAAVERLRIRTRRSSTNAQAAIPGAPRAPIPVTAIDSLARLGSDLPEGTLREALASLVARRR